MSQTNFIWAIKAKASGETLYPSPAERAAFIEEAQRQNAIMRRAGLFWQCYRSGLVSADINGVLFDRRSASLCTKSIPAMMNGLAAGLPALAVLRRMNATSYSLSLQISALMAWRLTVLPSLVLSDLTFPHESLSCCHCYVRLWAPSKHPLIKF